MKTIDHREILDHLATGQPLLCIDVRERYRQATLDVGGWKIPYNEIARRAEWLLPFRECLTVVCCLRPSGSQRTLIAFNALRKLGFSDVRELKNGLYQGWILKVGRKVKLPVAAQNLGYDSVVVYGYTVDEKESGARGSDLCDLYFFRHRYYRYMAKQTFIMQNGAKK